LQTTISKNQTISSSNSKILPTTYISCSTLQSGIASYSIPKTRRFKDSYKVSYCESIYSLPELKSTGVSIGNSTRKHLFDKKFNVPSVHDYVHTSVFEENVKKKKGYSISNKIKIKVKLLGFYFVNILIFAKKGIITIFNWKAFVFLIFNLSNLYKINFNLFNFNFFLFI